MSLLGRGCGWAGVALACALGAASAQTNVVMPPVPLLPHSAQLVDAPAGLVPADSVEMQAVLKEDGLQRQDSRGLTGAPEAWIEAYQFDDATGAFSAYTYLRQGGKPFAGADVPKTAFRKADGEVVFLSGTSVVRAHLPGVSAPASAGVLGTVQTGLPKIGGRKGLAPLLPTMLPAAGGELESLRYAVGPVGYAAMHGVLPKGNLGWDKSVEVATADYDHGKGQLTLLLYPTPQLAGDRGRALQGDLNQAGPASFGTVKMRRVGPLLGVTTGALSALRAEELVQALKLNEEVTFDKPMPLEFHAEVRKTYTLLQSISIFIGIGILAALVLAVFLGGARAGVRLLQGKPAASDAEFLTINLRGASRQLRKGDPPPPAV